VPLSAGNAACTTHDLAVAGPAAQSMGLVAHYEGDANNPASTSPALMVTIPDAGDVIFRQGTEPESADCPIV
jgi:hypothetical protein